MKRNLIARMVWPVEKAHWDRIKEKVPPETINGAPKLPCTFGKLEKSISQEGWDKLSADALPAEYLQLALLRRSVQYAMEYSEQRRIPMDCIPGGEGTAERMGEIERLEAYLRRVVFALIAREMRGDGMRNGILIIP